MYPSTTLYLTFYYYQHYYTCLNFDSCILKCLVITVFIVVTRYIIMFISILSPFSAFFLLQRLHLLISIDKSL